MGVGRIRAGYGNSVLQARAALGTKSSATFGISSRPLQDIRNKAHHHPAGLTKPSWAANIRKYLDAMPLPWPGMTTMPSMERFRIPDRDEYCPALYHRCIKPGDPNV